MWTFFEAWFMYKNYLEIVIMKHQLVSFWHLNFIFLVYISLKFLSVLYFIAGFAIESNTDALGEPNNGHPGITGIGNRVAKWRIAQS